MKLDRKKVCAEKVLSFFCLADQPPRQASRTRASPQAGCPPPRPGGVSRAASRGSRGNGQSDGMRKAGFHLREGKHTPWDLPKLVSRPAFAPYVKGWGLGAWSVERGAGRSLVVQGEKCMIVVGNISREGTNVKKTSKKTAVFIAGLCRRYADKGSSAGRARPVMQPGPGRYLLIWLGADCSGKGWRAASPATEGRGAACHHTAHPTPQASGRLGALACSDVPYPMFGFGCERATCRWPRVSRGGLDRPH
ncbi:hypothetical protein MAPG_00639 [Magnaporthiopsis poae ATCC 64411]|uniref:Uncharacterized protein n=1 Tax=Magnaporthiopsis poae (strain ATCC 64411 / 73-15) TaxID=644358 RepID=A0A0C4DLJ5_MAGP6|nr:hypothetical protein MAPG_00639 [Magnaporthiopsis poae ATCC 64411]